MKNAQPRRRKVEGSHQMQISESYDIIISYSQIKGANPRATRACPSDTVSQENKKLLEIVKQTGFVPMWHAQMGPRGP